ncbi:MAG: enoyl-CoA hydratase-related protein [Eubacteriales bacterium]
MDNITLTQEGKVALVTMNRPKAMNALDSKTIDELSSLMTQLEGDDNVHVIVITGAEKAFVAGADIKEMADYFPKEAKDFSRKGNAVFSQIENCVKPVIAAVNGFALGGGCELAMCCDFRVASEKAKFGLPEVGLGIIPGFGGTQRLGRIIGVSKALELTLTTEIFNAATAKELGLVNYVYSPEDLLPKVMEMAQTIAAKPQVSVRQAKACIRRGTNMDIQSATAFEMEAFALTFSTEDQKDAMEAYLNKGKIEIFKNK